MDDRRVAIVTGGSHGIGAGLVAAYRRQGWMVVANARTTHPSEDRDVLEVDGDVSQPATTDRIISEALERFGRIDTLINNAGVFIEKPFTDYTIADYESVVGVNLTGFFRLTQRVIPEMLRAGGGHVVNITTTLADYANSTIPSVSDRTHQGRRRRSHEILGDRVRVPRHPGQRGFAWRDPDGDECARDFTTRSPGSTLLGA